MQWDLTIIFIILFLYQNNKAIRASNGFVIELANNIYGIKFLRFNKDSVNFTSFSELNIEKGK